MRFLILLIGLPVFAHTLYFLPGKFRVTPGETLVVSLHNGDSFPEADDGVAPERIGEAALTGGGGVKPITDFLRLGRATHAVVKVDGIGSQWLGLRTRNNLLETDRAKFEQYMRDEGLTNTLGEPAGPVRERYVKHAKALVVSGAADDGWKRVLGLDLEFVPEADPSALKPGDVLPVRVLWKGEPARGVRVEKAWAAAGRHAIEIAGRTDAEGRILIPLDKAAKWRLHTVVMEPTKGDPEAEWQSYWATLTFELPPTMR